MPELPEVETVVRQLRPHLQGQRIKSLSVIDPKLSHLVSAPLNERRIEAVQRVGKYIVLSLNALNGDDRYLAVHLRMTGRLIWNEHRLGPDLIHVPVAMHDPAQHGGKHLRAQFDLEHGALRFIDPRRFGTIELVADKYTLCKGVDPFAAQLDATLMAGMLGKSKQPIKQWLLDQNNIAGVGNIYACEALFGAGIDPKRPAQQIKTREAQQLLHTLREVMTQAIEHGGTTFSDFQDTSGRRGENAAYLRVYGREGEPCSACNQPLERLVQAQRSTFYCARCQH